MAILNYAVASKIMSEDSPVWSTLKAIYDSSNSDIPTKSKEIALFVAHFAMSQVLHKHKESTFNEQVAYAKELISQVNEIYPFNVDYAVNKVITMIQVYSSFSSGVYDYSKLKHFLNALAQTNNEETDTERNGTVEDHAWYALQSLISNEGEKE